MKRREFVIKSGDTSPALLWQIDPPVNLAGATVRFNMRVPGAAVVVNRAAASVAALPDPTLRYDWSAPDTATPGLFEAEFEVTYADGKVETWPNEGYIAVHIWDDIA
jgi:hypothetical protein